MENPQQTEVVKQAMKEMSENKGPGQAGNPSGLTTFPTLSEHARKTLPTSDLPLEVQKLLGKIAQ